MVGWKHVWALVAEELGLTIEKTDIHDRPTLMQGMIGGTAVRVTHFAERGDQKAKVTVAFALDGPPHGLIMKRRTSGHWKMAPKLHPQHRRVGLWEVWASDVDALDEWLTDERERVIMHLDPAVELTNAGYTAVAPNAQDRDSMLRVIKKAADEASALAGSPAVG